MSEETKPTYAELADALRRVRDERDDLRAQLATRDAPDTAALRQRAARMCYDLLRDQTKRRLDNCELFLDAICDYNDARRGKK